MRKYLIRRPGMKTNYFFQTGISCGEKRMEYDAKVTNSPRRGFQTFLHFQQICRSCRNPICTLSQGFELHTGSFGHPTF